MLRFDKVVAGLVSGAFALFSASRNGHVASLISAGSVANGQMSALRLPVQKAARCTVERTYYCTEAGFLLRRLQLHQWRHKTTVIYTSPDEVLVRDELVWPVCSAQRQYTLKRSARAPGLERHDDNWQLSGTSAFFDMTVKHKLVSALLKADKDIFWAYVHEGDDDQDKVHETDHDEAQDPFMSIVSLMDF